MDSHRQASAPSANDAVTAAASRIDGPVAGTIEIWSDVACPWASLAVHRLLATRSRLQLDEEVRLDHRAFPLELHNARPTPRVVLEAEVAVIGAHEPALNWSAWRGPAENWPGSVLVALEAVQAAKSAEVGGLAASEELDAALRDGFYRDHRPIGLLPEILTIAAKCDAVDEDVLASALESGVGRAAVMRDYHEGPARGVKGSPHLFLPGGRDVHNPGVTMSWSGGRPGEGFPVITEDDPSVYDDLVRVALAPSG